jgi:hypothetical protein
LIVSSTSIETKTIIKWHWSCLRVLVKASLPLKLSYKGYLVQSNFRFVERLPAVLLAISGIAFAQSAVALVTVESEADLVCESGSFSGNSFTTCGVYDPIFEPTAVRVGDTATFLTTFSDGASFVAFTDPFVPEWGFTLFSRVDSTNSFEQSDFIVRSFQLVDATGVPITGDLQGAGGDRRFKATGDPDGNAFPASGGDPCLLETGGFDPACSGQSIFGFLLTLEVVGPNPNDPDAIAATEILVEPTEFSLTAGRVEVSRPAVPIPAPVVLLGLGLIGIGWMRRRN